MTETRLRTWISLFIMVSHVLVLLGVVALYQQGRFRDEELTTTMSIMVPPLSALTTLAVSFAVSMKNKKVFRTRSEQLSGIYMFTALFFPIGFVAMLFAVIVVRAKDGFSSFQQFKLSLAAVETIFAGYSGKIMASLFGSGVSS